MRETRGDWRDLFLTFRMALDLRKISLCLVGMAATAAGIALILAVALFFWQKKNNQTGLVDDFKDGRLDRVQVRLANFSQSLFPAVSCASSRACPAGPVRIRVRRQGCPVACCPLTRLCHPTRAGMVVLGWSVLWIVGVWAFFGGAVTRIAAVELAKDERIEFAEATRFAKAHYGSYLWSPLSIVAAAAAFALCILGAGWLCQATWDFALGKVLLVLGLPLALLGGLLIVLLVIGGILGAGLLFPAVSAEGTDAFDAVSRAFSYVFSRPWKWLFYHLVGLAYAVPSCLFVCWITQASLKAALGLGRACGGGKLDAAFSALPPSLGGTLTMPAFSDGALTWLAALASASVVYVILGLSKAYLISYVWTMRTTIYFLLRKAVDGTAMNEVYEEESEEDLVAGGASPGAAPPPAPAA